MIIRLFDPADDLSWMDDALCVETDPEQFFPEPGGGAGRNAKRICARCEVQPECLDYALRHDDVIGVWGGLTDNERYRLGRRAA